MKQRENRISHESFATDETMDPDSESDDASIKTPMEVLDFISNSKCLGQHTKMDVYRILWLVFMKRIDESVAEEHVKYLLFGDSKAHDVFVQYMEECRFLEEVLK